MSEPGATLHARRAGLPATPVLHALVLRQGGVMPRRIALGETPIRIGSGPANELVLPSQDVSERHCHIGVIGGVAVLSDLQSSTGVHVGGERVREAVTLQPGACIAIGPFTLIYSRGPAEQIAELEAAERERATALSHLQAVLPPPLHDGPVRADWRFEPSASLGGNAFGYRWLNARSLALFLLNVPGHGTGAALQAVATVRLMSAPELGIDPADPASILRGLNTSLRGPEAGPLSLWYGVYDHPSRSLRFATAAHHPAYLKRGAELIALGTSGPALGTNPRARFGVAEAAVARRSRLFLFSKGLFEVAPASGPRGSMADVVALLRQADAGGQPDRLLEVVRERAADQPLEDDVSLLAFEFT